ncbi:MAG TPA: EamA family transporter [Armatimonadota bacterium]
MRSPLGLLLAAIALGSVGQIFLKIGMSSPAGKSAHGILGLVRVMLTQPYVVVGLLCYGLSSILYLKVIQQLDLSLVYPMVAVSYVLVSILSFLLLKERIPALRVLGLGIIVIGVIVMSLSTRPASRTSSLAGDGPKADPHDALPKTVSR